MSEVVKTMTLAETRNILSSEIDRLRKGDTTASNVNAICNAIGKFLGSVKLELEIDRLIGRKPHAMLAAIEAPGLQTEPAAAPDPQKPN
jgi:hypothetical protein